MCLRLKMVGDVLGRLIKFRKKKKKNTQFSPKVHSESTPAL